MRTPVRKLLLRCFTSILFTNTHKPVEVPGVARLPWAARWLSCQAGPAGWRGQGGGGPCSGDPCAPSPRAPAHSHLAALPWHLSHRSLFVYISYQNKRSQLVRQRPHLDVLQHKNIEFGSPVRAKQKGWYFGEFDLPEASRTPNEKLVQNLFFR